MCKSVHHRFKKLKAGFPSASRPSPCAAVKPLNHPSGCVPRCLRLGPWPVAQTIEVHNVVRHFKKCVTEFRYAYMLCVYPTVFRRLVAYHSFSPDLQFTGSVCTKREAWLSLAIFLWQCVLRANNNCGRRFGATHPLRVLVKLVANLEEIRVPGQVPEVDAYRLAVHLDRLHPVVDPDSRYVL